MHADNRGSSLLFLVFSIFICAESLSLGIGKPSSPGPGFMAFGGSILLGILSLTQFLLGVFGGGETEKQSPFAGTSWQKVALVLLALLIYAKLLRIGGYLITTFLLMSFLLGIIERQKAWVILLLSFLATIGSYYFFSVLLNCQFPSGIIEF